MATNPANVPRCLYCLRDATFKVNIRNRDTGQQPVGQIYCCEYCRHNLDEDKDHYFIRVKGKPTWHLLTDIPVKLNLENIIG